MVPWVSPAGQGQTRANRKAPTTTEEMTMEDLLVKMRRNQDRRGKQSRDGYLWCAECGGVELSIEGGDLCGACIPRVNKQEAARAKARRRAESGRTEDEG
jgi:hypothetical protein